MTAPAATRIRKIASLARKDLLQVHAEANETFNEWVRRKVLQDRRIDLLAEILGYEVRAHHLKMMKHQARHRECLVLCARGFGKTKVCTITRSIFLLLRNPNLKILIASKTQQNAMDMLFEVKKQFETNERLRAIFGDFVGHERWDKESINVKPRRIPDKEPSINTVGWEGAIASKHYDVILGDDLVDEDNSRTKFQREKMLDWYYKALIPCLEPPTEDVEHRGELGIIGTRYHYDDLYGHLQADQPDGTGGEMKEHTLIIPALSPEGKSAWPERFPVEVLEKKKGMGILRFNSQYQCDTEAMKGQVFRYDDCKIVDDSEIPPLEDMRVTLGVDLAISESEKADMFALIALGYHAASENYYLLDYFEGQLRFSAQGDRIIEFWRRWKVHRVGLEVNAYQKAQMHQLKDREKEMNILPIHTATDKMTRAWNLAGLFEAGRMHFKREHMRVVEHLVLFPGYRYKDLFDALDLAVRASRQRVRRKRAREPGLI